MSRATATEHGDRETQHDDVEHACQGAVAAALDLGTARIDEHALAVQAVLRPGLSAMQVWPRLVSLLERYGDVRRELDRLADGLSLLRPGGRRKLQGKVLRLAGAVSRFGLWWDKVESCAIALGAGERFANQTAPQLQRQIDRDIYGRCGIRSGTLADLQPDGRKTSDLQAEAMKKTVEAVLTAGKVEILLEDLERLIWHLGQIVAMAEQASTRSSAARSLDEARNAAIEVQHAISGRPELALMASEIASLIEELRALAPGR